MPHHDSQGKVGAADGAFVGSVVGTAVGLTGAGDVGASVGIHSVGKISTKGEVRVSTNALQAVFSAPMRFSLGRELGAANP